MGKLFNHYRPELHYMRGPGPKWLEKHGIFRNLTVSYDHDPDHYRKLDVSVRSVVDADLSHVNLHRAGLSRAKLSGANLSHANLSGAVCPNGKVHKHGGNC